MGRSDVTTIIQSYEEDCGPASIKHALAVFGKRRSLSYLSGLCKTSRNGTSTKNMINALNKLGFTVMSIENANLKHLISALKNPPNEPRAVIVSYLYVAKGTGENWKESGHWAAVSSYHAHNGRIVIFDSYTGQKKSYVWHEFKKLWKDYDLVRKRIGKRKYSYEYTKKWHHRLMFIISQSPENLPEFTISTSKIHNPLL